MPTIKPVYMRKLSSRMKYRTYKKNRKTNLFFWVILYLTLILFTSKLFEQTIWPDMLVYADSEAQYQATLLVDKAITEYIEENKITYDQFFTLEKNEQGQVTALISNTSSINQMKSKLSVTIQNRLNEIEDCTINVPVLNFSGNIFLSKFSMKLPVFIYANGNFSMDIKNKFTSVGINQTKHEIYLECKSELSMLFPGRYCTHEVVSVVPITQAVIVGVVPDTYVNIDGKPINQVKDEITESNDTNDNQ